MYFVRSVHRHGTGSKIAVTPQRIRATLPEMPNLPPAHCRRSYKGEEVCKEERGEYILDSNYSPNGVNMSRVRPTQSKFTYCHRQQTPWFFTSDG